jgi:hypothetical protein
MPVRIRLAHAFMATYLVSAEPAQRLIDYSGLRLLRLPGGRAMCTLVFVDYVDGDLGPYNEFGVSFMVRHHAAGAASGFGDVRALVTGRAGVLIHRLPVDGDFTLAAGRGIWGFPKELAEFATTVAGRAPARCTRMGSSSPISRFGPGSRLRTAPPGPRSTPTLISMASPAARAGRCGLRACERVSAGPS